VTGTRVLVVENDPSNDLGRLGIWLSEAGVQPHLLRPHAGDPLPDTLEGYAGLVVLGGAQRAYADLKGPTPEAPLAGSNPAPDTVWFAALRKLFRRAGADRIPTLAIGLGAQLLAQAYGGEVAPAQNGPEIGPRLVAKRDAAASDPLFAELPLTPDVLQWHHDEIIRLPAGATLLAASPRCTHQAFRVGTRCWGLQFHIECDAAMIEQWVAAEDTWSADLDIDPERAVEACQAILSDLEEAWRPFTERFAGVVTGHLAADSDPSRQLPLLGS